MLLRLLHQDSVQEVRVEGAHATLLNLLQRDHDNILAAFSGLDPSVTASTLLDVGPISSALQASNHTCATLTPTMTGAACTIRPDLSLLLRLKHQDMVPPISRMSERFMQPCQAGHHGSTLQGLQNASSSRVKLDTMVKHVLQDSSCCTAVLKQSFRNVVPIRSPSSAAGSRHCARTRPWRC